MQTEEYKRLTCRMNEVQPSDKAAVLIVMDCGKDFRVSTYGEVRDIQALKQWAQSWLGSVQNGGRG